VSQENNMEKAERNLLGTAEDSMELGEREVGIFRSGFCTALGGYLGEVRNGKQCVAILVFSGGGFQKFLDVRDVDD
jgi:hypothetical protein